MKKYLTRAILCLLLALYICTGLPLAPLASAASAPAQGDYACILQDGTYFYAYPEERRGLFLLPTTYYVRLLEYGADYCKIEYLTDDVHSQRIVGYAKTDTLTFVDYTPRRPYLYYVFDVKYRIDETDTEDSTFLTQYTVTCAYYGDYTIGTETYCYVLRGEEFGYIPKPVTLSYEENTEYADYLASLPPVTSTDTQTPAVKKNTPSPIQIGILVALCLLVPVLAALILKPPRRPPYEADE